MSRELVIYCDESESRGRYFSNFYGGLLVRADQLQIVAARMASQKDALGLRAELKWSSITPSVEERYRQMMTGLFDELLAGTAKIRIMFTQNRDIPDLTRAQRDTSYHRLYYQFVKHAFGLEHAGCAPDTTRVRLLLDRMPTTAEQTSQFKSFVTALSHRPAFRRARIEFPLDHIGEIDSHQHILAQCLDVVLGAMAFRLNDRHLDKPEGARTRGRRTLAKERVYRHINRLIRELRPGFNIGVSTGLPDGTAGRWTQAYRHWLLVPTNAVRDDAKTKKGKAP